MRLVAGAAKVGPTPPWVAATSGGIQLGSESGRFSVAPQSSSSSWVPPFATASFLDLLNITLEREGLEASRLSRIISGGEEGKPFNSAN